MTHSHKTPSSQTGRPELIAGRVAGAALLAWMAWIHLHVWSDGYMHLHVVGPMFLANFILAVLLALALLGVPNRVLPLAAGGAGLLAAGTLVLLAVSINVGLFGFTDYLHGPFVVISIWVESAATVVMVALAVRAARANRGRHPR